MAESTRTGGVDVNNLFFLVCLDTPVNRPKLYLLVCSHYGRSNCYTRGTGGTTYSLRIPGVASYPDCGTEKVET